MNGHREKVQGSHLGEGLGATVGVDSKDLIRSARTNGRNQFSVVSATECRTCVKEEPGLGNNIVTSLNKAMSKPYLHHVNARATRGSATTRATARCWTIVGQMAPILASVALELHRSAISSCY